MSTFEEYIKPAISGVLGTALGITITYSTGVANNREEIVRLTTQVQNLTSVVQEKFGDRYTNREALKDLQVINDKLKEIKDHDVALERALRDHVHGSNPNGLIRK